MNKHTWLLGQLRANEIGNEAADLIEMLEASLVHATDKLALQAKRIAELEAALTTVWGSEMDAILRARALVSPHDGLVDAAAKAILNE